jgi:hypothetical protein
VIDGGLRSLFRQHLRVGFDWTSIESGATGGGIPDSNYCSQGIEGWLEYKAADAVAVSFRPEQPGWLERRFRAGGRCTVAVRRQHKGGSRKGLPADELWMLDGAKAGLIQEVGLVRDMTYVLGVFPDGPARWNWDVVREILLRNV